MKILIKHIAFRFILLLIPYLAFYFMYAESGFKGQTYDIDEIPLYVFFTVWVYILVETFFWLYKKNRTKWLSNIAVLLLMAALYFILPHRNYFN
ncbi:hypothetical protein [Chryseobacterium indologenes]|uniref:Uncharacterized protein n=1 Tax=Chryseobacterium indologenes TaxID=253 RepID=A0A0N1KUR9_CHRID|nr:hypothetical protein [Chryseobacterium indologenes]KPE53145.1 hypothetical protein AOB46_03950 [Chryseobacterium indologenes]